MTWEKMWAYVETGSGINGSSFWWSKHINTHQHISRYRNSLRSPPFLLCSPYPPSPSFSPFLGSICAQWAEWIHFNWHVAVALWPGYKQWVMHEGPTYCGFQWGMTLSGTNRVCVCAFVCIFSLDQTSNERSQSQLSLSSLCVGVCL